MKVRNPPSESTKVEVSLKGKAVLTTGSNSGIGRSVAMLMARKGAEISFAYLPEEQRDAQDTKKMIEQSGRQALLLNFDFTDEENCQKIVDASTKRFGKLSMLVNNAAIQEMCDDLKDINLDVVEKRYRTNVLSMFSMTKIALPHMKRGSAIINSSLVAGYIGNPQLVDYSSTKAAIATFTSSLGPTTSAERNQVERSGARYHLASGFAAGHEEQRGRIWVTWV